MSKLVKFEEGALHAPYMNEENKRVLKNLICRDLTDAEFEVFGMTCERAKLDPFAKQIYAIKRNQSKKDENGKWVTEKVMTIQTSIDGLRLIADRTGCYAPGPSAKYEYDKNGCLFRAVAYVKKFTRDGTWHLVEGEAFWIEYCPVTKEGAPTGQWAKMPHVMLAKCAESLAIRRAFPSDTSGIYTDDEMHQADSEIIEHKIAPISAKITSEQAFEIECLLEECEPNYKKWFYEFIFKNYKAEILLDLPADIFEKAKNAVLEAMHKYQQKQKEVFEKGQKMLENHTSDTSFDVANLNTDQVTA